MSKTLNKRILNSQKILVRVNGSVSFYTTAKAIRTGTVGDFTQLNEAIKWTMDVIDRDRAADRKRKEKAETVGYGNTFGPFQIQLTVV